MQDSINVLMQAIEEKVEQFLRVVLCITLKLRLKLTNHMFKSARSYSIAITLVQHLK